MSSSTTHLSETSAYGAVTATDVGLLLLRIALAVVFIAHGGQKVFGWFGGNGLEATVSGMTKGGIPTFLAYAAAFTEFFGGVAVLVGVLTRLASLGLAITMAVAMFKVHWANGFFLADKGFEYTFVLLFLSLALLLMGPGKLAIADLEARFFKRR
jgi:putative oxidoreductase